MGEEVKQAEAKAEEEKVEEKKEEEKPAEEKKEEEAPPRAPSPFVLFVDLHCAGCAKKIERSIMKIRGVEGVVMDMVQNQVTIKGIVEPQVACNRIMKKTKRRAKVLSPLPEAEGEPMPQVVTSQVSRSTTVELNINMHCEACAEQLKRKILKMRGVQTVVTELSTGKVTVTGTMDAEKLVDYVYRRTKKQARIVPQPEPEPEKKEEEKKEEEKPTAEEAKPAPEEEKKEEKEEKKEEEKPQTAAEEPKKEEGEIKEPAAENKEEEGKKGGESEIITTIDEENMKRMMYYYQPLYVIERIPPPQLFSDENPNACSIS
ncbi:copper ion binding protein, putative [Ricinus communis]|uniref:Copper ion binding protein, putative n=1 Tax=Ricinus communis TaxID=3988 RepID=B9S5N9_RICCO|nr:copper ion binding protein, putative [Ricinus communis]|eukprot:XP_002521308.1 heavy metal-associated isoprenylated plant protein 9 [Ricinus communis]